MRQSLLLVIVAVVLVAAGAFFFMDTEAPEAGGASSLGRTDVARSGPVAPAGEVSLTEAPDKADPERKQVVDRAAVLTPRPVARDTAMAASGPAVRGRVVDTNGNPLANARVVVAGNDPMPLDSLGDANSDFGRRLHGTTDANGEFAIQGAEPGGLRLGVWLGGYAPLEREQLSLPAGEAGLTLDDSVLVLGVVLEGTVVVEGGGAIEGAELFAEELSDDGFSFMMPGGKRRPLAVTDASGFFRIDTLGAGPWKIKVKSDAAPSRSFEGRTANPGERSTGLDFVLTHGVSISGRLTEIPADLGADLVVRATPKRSRTSWVPGGERRESNLDSQGNFSIEGCEDGKTYEVVAMEKTDQQARVFGRGQPTRTAMVEAQGGQSNLNLKWLGITGLNFRVVDASGVALENFSVSSGSMFQTAVREDDELKRYFPGGRVTLDDVAQNRRFGRNGPFKVTVQAAGFADFEHEVDVQVGKVLDLGDFRLQAASMLSLYVKDAQTGEPVEGARVRLSIAGAQNEVFGLFDGGGGSTPNNGTNSRTAKTNAEGLARLSLYSGEVAELSVGSSDYTDFADTNFAMPATGNMEHEVRLGTGGRAEITALDALGVPIAGIEIKQRVFVAPTNDGGQLSGAFALSVDVDSGGRADRVITDGKGVATFEHLEPGTHEFKLGSRQGGGNMIMEFAGANAPGAGGWTALDVVEAGEHELSLKEEPRGILTGIVRQQGRALSGAQLKLVDGGSDDPFAAMMFGGAAGPGSGSTDGRGRFELSGVKPGSYVLEVRHPDRAMPHEVPIELTAGANSIEVDLSLTIVEGTVTDADGEPMAGVKVKVEGLSGSSSSMFAMVIMDTGDGDGVITMGGEGADPSVTDARGHYELRGVTPDKELQVKASTPDTSPATSEPFQVAEGEVKRGVDLVLTPAGEVVVSVEGLGEEDFAMVQGTYLGEEEGVGDVSEFAPGGSVKLSGLRPGPWEISVRLFSEELSSPEPREVEVIASETLPLAFSL